MDDYESLNHTKWECKYHVVFIPKCRRKKLYQQLRQDLGEVFRQLAQRKESQILEGHLVVDHVHMLISIPPKYAVAQVIGYIKGKSAIHIARTVGGRQRNFTGEHFWRAATSCPPSAATRRRFGNTSSGRKRRIAGWTRGRCSINRRRRRLLNNPL